MRGAGRRWKWILPALLLHPTLAIAQTPLELAEARKLFASALADEEQLSFEAALEKFRRVQAVRETVAVRYRIGACLEALGRWKEAIVAYDGAIALGSGGDPNNAESIQAARARVIDLTKRLPQLTVKLSENAPPDAAVEIDHESVPPATLRNAMPVDPGTHVVFARATGAAPFRTEVTVAEGAHVVLVIPFLSSAPGVVAESSPPPVTSAQPHPHRTAGAIAVGAGVALLAGAGVAAVLRHGDISDLHDACPNGLCPKSREAELLSTRSSAVSDGVIAAILAGTGLVAGGIGAYFLFFADAGAPTVSAALSETDARIMIRGSF